MIDCLKNKIFKMKKMPGPLSETEKKRLAEDKPKSFSFPDNLKEVERSCNEFHSTRERLDYLRLIQEKLNDEMLSRIFDRDDFFRQGIEEALKDVRSKGYFALSDIENQIKKPLFEGHRKSKALAHIKGLEDFKEWHVLRDNIEITFRDNRPKIKLDEKNFGQKTFFRLLFILGGHDQDMKPDQRQDINEKLKKCFDTPIVFFQKNKPLPAFIRLSRSKINSRDEACREHSQTRYEELEDEIS